MRHLGSIVVISFATLASVNGCAPMHASEAPASPSMARGKHYPQSYPAPSEAAPYGAPGQPMMDARSSRADESRPAPPPPPVSVGKLAVATPKTPVVVAQPAPEPTGTEQYTDYGVNPVTNPAKDPLSTFAIDVDTASYTIARSKLTSGTLPPFASVRAEEFINYFNYGYAGPKSGPFAVHLATAPSPYQKGHHLLRVGLQAKKVSHANRTPVHLVYLVDTSGSMRRPNKMGLAKKSLKLLTNELKAGDTVALCTYAGSVREVLPPTGANQQTAIHNAIDQLTAGGSTAMSSGIELAYKLAKRTLVKGHVNRVIVLSDGDANVGPSSHQEILKRIAQYKDQGITLSTIGFGRGNYKDTMMEQLANKGDGNYSYIDSEPEARRVFGEQVSGVLQVVARDVKIQVQFDPKVVQSYRLIGYENRDVADRDFRNDKVDAGEIGAGHNVTAIYDVVLKSNVAAGRTPVVVRLRHKKALGSNVATEQLHKLQSSEMFSSFATAPANFRFAAAVAGFAEILRKSPQAKRWSFDTVEQVARTASWGQREQAELLRLVAQAKRLMPNKPLVTPGTAVMAK